MSENPYNLRASLLKQAQEILERKFYITNERLRYLCDKNLADPTTVIWPEIPTTEDIIAEAEKLYRFVCTK